MTRRFPTTCFSAMALCALFAGSVEADEQSTLDRWRFHFEELRIQELWLEVSQAHEPRTVLIENANLLAMTGPQRQADMSVLVEEGRIAWIGPADEAKPPSNCVRVDATDKTLLPGLADMHVHRLESSAQALLSIANGVTTERELCGFEWQLAQRELIRAGALLAPDLHISGHILNARPMGMYATVVESAEHARQVARDQVESGFDFLKVHNNLPVDIYRAIVSEGNRLGVRVVGHVPQEVRLEEALRLGQHTLEHFKGYILDRTLELTSEDYVGLTRTWNPWNCPTLSTWSVGLVGEEALRFLDEFEGMRYVSIYDRQRWRTLAETKSPNNSHARVWKLSQRIFKDLVETDARFLTGSDSGGGYENQAPGFMLHEELRLMEELGLPTYEVLQAATTYAAQALDSEDTGTIEMGKRANLVLVDGNPLESVAHLRHPAGVMVRGVWLDRATLDGILKRIEEIYAHGGKASPLRPPTDEELDDYLERLQELYRQEFVFVDHHVEELVSLFASRGRSTDVLRAVQRR